MNGSPISVLLFYIFFSSSNNAVIIDSSFVKKNINDTQFQLAYKFCIVIVIMQAYTFRPIVVNSVLGRKTFAIEKKKRSEHILPQTQTQLFEYYNSNYFVKMETEHRALSIEHIHRQFIYNSQSHRHCYITKMTTTTLLPSSYLFY